MLQQSEGMGGNSKDLFSTEIGNEFLYPDPPATRIPDQTGYIPSSDIIPLNGGQSDPLEHHRDQIDEQLVQNVSQNKQNNSFQLLKTMRSDSQDDEKNETFNNLTTESSIEYFDPNVNLDDLRKHNHSEIEKRRREKMNSLIKELAKLVPMCNAIPSTRKLDKLTVLRMTVQHIRAIRNSKTISESITQTPSFISEEIVGRLISQVTEGFLFVVSCDRGKILYVSESVKQTLNYNKRDLLGISWFDVLHQKDIPKVKEQLSLWDTTPKEKLVDAKTLLPLDDNVNAQGGQNCNSHIQSCPGSRRSFFCRMKYKFYLSKNEGNGIKGLAKKKRRRINIMNDKYCDLYCMGYLKSWTPIAEDTNMDCESALNNVVNNNTGCLVAMARVLPQISAMDRKPRVRNQNFPIKPIEYTSRHGMDGVYLFVDQRVTPLLGYLPQELLGTSCYDYCHPDDVKTLAESHRRALHQNDKKTSAPYRFKTKVGTYLYLKTFWKIFKNPWTREFEYMIAVNENVVTPDLDAIKTNANHSINETNIGHKVKSNSKSKPTDNPIINIQTELVNRGDKQSHCSSLASSDGLTPSSSNCSGHSSHKSVISSDSPISQLTSTSLMKRFINNRIKHRKIGQQIAEEILDAQRRADEFSSSSSQSSNSPPSSLDTANSSINGSMSGSGSSSSINDKSIGLNSAYDMKSRSVQSLPSLSASDSGIDNNTYDNVSLPSLPSLPSLSSSSLTDISQLEAIPHINNRYLDSTHNHTMDEISPHLNNHPIVINHQNIHHNIVFNGTPIHQQNDVNEESDEAAMSLIMSILEADAGLGGPVDFSGMPWPLY